MKNKIIIIATIWLLLAGASLAFNLGQAQENHRALALWTARSFYEQVLISRAWNAEHGGVYVPVTPSSPANPYLEDADRDLVINEHLRLTKVNPAYMTRQIAELSNKEDGIRFRITSLKPIRPENRPSPREEIALKAFEQGQKEAGEFFRDVGGERFFFMAPLITRAACLKCHAKQGYKEGDISGGISVSVPFAFQPPVSAIWWSHLIIGLAGVLGIVGYGAKLNRAYERLQHQAVFDALTGIPNRRNFTEHLLREHASSRRYQKPLSVIMCDIDNFKAYNDLYGHTAGDQCLQQVAQAIKQQMRRPNDFCARYGGEEFVIILQDTPREGAMHVAELIRGAVLNMQILHQKSSPLQVVTVSLGVATSSQDEPVVHEELVQRADTALYAAKAKGRNRIEFFKDPTPA